MNARARLGALINTGLRSALVRIKAVLIKEFVQMRRDRLTLALMIAMPLGQLILFGYAINSDPKHLPTAVLSQDHGRLTRSIAAAMANSDYFDVARAIDDPAEGERLLQSGEVAFVVTFPASFTRDVLRGEPAQILVEADASDPSASSNALAQMQEIMTYALRNDLKAARGAGLTVAGPVSVVVHRAYNPEGRSQYNIVPGVVGIILTMTMVMITSIAMTRETERGTLENLLAMPAQPAEVMIGKITPYVLVGGVQTVIVLSAALILFHVPFQGDPFLLAASITLFIIANLSVGFLISTVARSQMQAMQMTLFFFLPTILLSGFMFPFRGMPAWAQAIGDVIPTTHFLRIIRGIMLKGAGPAEVAPELFALILFTIAISAIALMRYRRTLD